MKVFIFPSKSSPSSPPHEARQWDDGSVTCTCRGFTHHGHCWHTDDVKAGKAASDGQEVLPSCKKHKHYDDSCHECYDLAYGKNSDNTDFNPEELE